MAGDPASKPTVVRNRSVATSETIGFTLLAVIPAGVMPAAVSAGGPPAPTVRAVTVSLAVAGVAVCAFFVMRAWQQVAVIDSAGIRVRNLTRSHLIAWSQLGGLDVVCRANRASVWWVTRLMLRDSDQVVRVGVSYASHAGPAEEFARRVRQRAPAGTPTAEPGPPRILRPINGGPVQAARSRYQVRSWRSLRSSMVVVLLTTALALAASLIGPGLIELLVADPSDRGTGLTLLVVGVLLAGAVLRWCRSRLVVTTDGLRIRNALWPKRLPWNEIRTIVATEQVNWSGTRRQVMLSATTAGRVYPLWATTRRLDRAAAVRDQIMTLAPSTLAHD